MICPDIGYVLQKLLDFRAIVPALCTAEVMNTRAAFPEIGRPKRQLILEVSALVCIKNNTCSHQYQPPCFSHGVVTSGHTDLKN